MGWSVGAASPARSGPSVSWSAFPMGDATLQPRGADRPLPAFHRTLASWPLTQCLEEAGVVRRTTEEIPPRPEVLRSGGQGGLAGMGPSTTARLARMDRTFPRPALSYLSCSVSLAFDLGNSPSLSPHALTTLPPWPLLGVLSRAPLIFQTPNTITLSPGAVSSTTSNSILVVASLPSLTHLCLVRLPTRTVTCRAALWWCHIPCGPEAPPDPLTAQRMCQGAESAVHRLAAWTRGGTAHGTTGCPRRSTLR